MFLKKSLKADRAYYDRLEQGARWLADGADCASEREAHLGMANRYAALAGDLAADGASK